MELYSQSALNMGFDPDCKYLLPDCPQTSQTPCSPCVSDPPAPACAAYSCPYHCPCPCSCARLQTVSCVLGGRRGGGPARVTVAVLWWSGRQTEGVLGHLQE